MLCTIPARLHPVGQERIIFVNVDSFNDVKVFPLHRGKVFFSEFFLSFNFFPRSIPSEFLRSLLRHGHNLEYLFLHSDCHHALKRLWK